MRHIDVQKLATLDAGFEAHLECVPWNGGRGIAPKEANLMAERYPDPE